MKTKTWAASPSSVESTPATSSLNAVDRPCFMTGAGTAMMGPFPLILCLLQGLRLSRLNSSFEIQSEDGDRLLELRRGNVWGDEVLVDMFRQADSLAEAMFQDMLSDMRKAVDTQQQ
jgi:hypothetical protein